MMLDANGEIRVLHIISLRREAAGSALAAHLSPETRSNDRSLGDEPETLTGLDELRMEDRLLFKAADEQVGPPPELLELFEPWQEAGSEETGPQPPIGTVVQPLPEFEPVFSETGPVDPDAVVEDLPGFGPIVNETGPFRKALGADGAFPSAPR